jgi:pimeloyl-ACP methyl ester carboxylesterase
LRIPCVLWLAGLILMGTAPNVWALGRAEAESPSFHGFYLLSFDRYGGLASRYERDLAIEELQANREVTRIVIISYGWANDGESSFATYQSLITDIQASVGEPAGPGTVAVFGVGWDSSQSGFRKLFNGVLPLPVVADALAIVPDMLLFPLSFWSKAAMADRIGYGGLRSTLNQIFGEAYPEGTQHPEIYLIGHSFGTRVLSALMQDELAFFPVQAEEFISAEHVKGAVMLQPALAVDNLHGNARYPILVTQSRHDRANGLLYPLANLLINSYSFTAVEALIQNRVFGAVEGTLAAASDTVTRTAGQVTDMAIPGKREEGSEEQVREDADPDASKGEGGIRTLFSGLPVRTYRATRRS